MVKHLVNSRFQSNDVCEVVNLIARKLFRNQRLDGRINEHIQSGPGSDREDLWTINICYSDREMTDQS
jgi:hypothetical protein